MTTSKVYDNLSRLAEIRSQRSDSSVVSSHAYDYNSANQRIKATLQDGSYWEYAYDSLGQITNAVKKWSDNVLVAGQQFGYAYDSIGNRTSAKSGGDSGGSGLRTSSYTANSLNQYTERTVPDSFDVLGSAQSNATVTVNNLPTYRKGEYFWRGLTVTNTTSPQYPSVSVVGVQNNVGTNQEDAVTTITGNEHVPKTPEVYSYDLDGNLTGDGRWTYTWDGENRLIQMETDTNKVAGTSVLRQKLEFAYDHKARRISKKVSNWNGSSYTLTNSLNFVHDGWNLLAELCQTNALVRSYLWGLDLSGSLQRAGGVGGLLHIANYQSPVTSQFIAYDANGNAVKLISADAGSVSAEYDYGPFGKQLKSTGTASASNPIRFSGKYHDAETDLLYYGRRYLNLTVDRWISRDPAEESGGYNLFALLRNDALSRVDPIGEGELSTTGQANDEVQDIREILPEKEVKCKKTGDIVGKVRRWVGIDASFLGKMPSYQQPSNFHPAPLNNAYIGAYWKLEFVVTDQSALSRCTCRTFFNDGKVGWVQWIQPIYPSGTSAGSEQYDLHMPGFTSPHEPPFYGSIPSPTLVDFPGSVGVANPQRNEKFRARLFSAYKNDVWKYPDDHANHIEINDELEYVFELHITGPYPGSASAGYLKVQLKWND